VQAAVAGGSADSVGGEQHSRCGSTISSDADEDRVGSSSTNCHSVQCYYSCGWWQHCQPHHGCSSEAARRSVKVQSTFPQPWISVKLVYLGVLYENNMTQYLHHHVRLELGPCTLMIDQQQQQRPFNGL